ncbi:MAG: hypothetical protein AAF570_27335, partial [Bacteroidota bacterium]
EQCDVLDIESRIHYPTGVPFTEKQVVFFREIEGKRYQVLLWMRDLPEEKDQHGRGGIFMVQGFLIPPEVWDRAYGPLALLEAFRKVLYPGSKELLADIDVDRMMGTILELELELDPKVAVAGPKIEIGQAERDLFVLLSRLSRRRDQSEQLLIKGAAQDVSALMNRAMEILIGGRGQLDFDPAFDGGKIFFSPTIVLGYAEIEPVTGAPAHFDMASGELVVPEAMAYLKLPETPYEHWLKRFPDSNTTCKAAVRIHRQVLMLEEGGMPDWDGFDRDLLEANPGRVAKWAFQAARHDFPQSWKSVMASNRPQSEFVELLMSEKKSELLGKILLRTIVETPVTPAVMGTPPPVAQFSDEVLGLKLVETAWTGAEPQQAWMSQVEGEELV